MAYFKDQITHATSNPKTLWQTLKTITGDNAKKDNTHFQISLNGILISDSEKIARAFNDYFVTSVNEPASKFVTPSHPTSMFSPIPDQFSFAVISQDELLKVVNSLKNSHSCDIDGLNTSFLTTHLTPLYLFPSPYKSLY